MGIPGTGEIFDNYKIIKPLGEGGMGQVLLAEDIKLSRNVALKFLGTGKDKPDSIMQRRFENEAKILASLSHPNIVNIFSFGTHSNIQFLVMEYVEGSTLTRIIEKRSFGVADCLSVVKQISQGLEEAHRCGVLHRDIKPANILIDKQNKVKIVDFGISKSVMSEDPRLTQADHFIGTINYTAPEILKGHPPSPATDIFALGVVFFELLTGFNPFHTKNKFESIEKIKNGNIQLPDDISELVSTDIRKILTRCMALDQNQRYQMMQELVADLDNVNHESLPDFQGISLRPELIITNREKVRLKLLQAGYTDSQSRIVINMAAKMQQEFDENQIEDDKTISISLIDPVEDVESFEAKKDMANSVNQVTINQEILKGAVAAFESSKTKLQKSAKENNNEKISEGEPTESTSQAEPQKTKKEKTSIPFPLFNPEVMKKTILYGGILTLSFFFLNRMLALTTSNKSISPLSVALNVLGYSKTPIDGNIEQPTLDDSKKKGSQWLSLNALRKDSERDPSSISIGEASLDLPPVNSKYRYKIKKYNTKSGTILFDDEVSLDIRKQKKDRVVAYQKNKKSNHYNIVTLSGNVSIPLLSFKPKGGKKREIQLQGDHGSLYPLKPGTNNDFSYRMLFSNGRFKLSTRKCSVKESRSITHLEKNWEVFEIHCNTQHDQTVENTKIFYSPYLRRPLRTETEIQIGNKNLIETQELVDFHIPAK